MLCAEKRSKENGTLREELLRSNILYSLEEAKVLVEQCR